MQTTYEAANEALIDLLEVLYWRVISMHNHESCASKTHIYRDEVLALIEDARESLKEGIAA